MPLFAHSSFDLTFPLLAAALLTLAALAFFSRGSGLEDRTSCFFMGESVLAELPLLSGFSSRLPPHGLCLARFFSLDGQPLWDDGDGWIACDFTIFEASLIAWPLNPALGDYRLASLAALRQASDLQDELSSLNARSRRSTRL